jgi:hypothetical protein
MIRNEQLQVLTERSQERWLVQHVKRCFPDFAAGFQPAALLDCVRRNRRRAIRYFRTEAGISLYIDLVCLLGECFTEDPNLPWAREILANPSLDETQRRSMLYSKARAHLLGPIPQGRIRRSA